MPSGPPSRPMPLDFIPPNGACTAEIAASFTPTVPNSSASVTRTMRLMARVKKLVRAPDHFLLGVEQEHRGDRAEGLLLSDQHRFLGADKDCRRIEKAFLGTG